MVVMKVFIFWVFLLSSSFAIKFDEHYTFTPSQPDSYKEDEYRGNFLIVAPRTFRQSIPYTCSVNILQPIPSDNSLFTEIKDGVNGTVFASAYANNLKEGVSQNIQLSTIREHLNSQRFNQVQYSLYARIESNGTILFEQNQTLKFDPKSTSVYVQTDKAVYKPGTKVLYRVLAIRPDLQPYRGNVLVKIIDPHDNIIQQFLNTSLFRGIFSGEMSLASEPPLGDWSIKVDTNEGVEIRRTFSVEKYVLPKFEVFIHPPPFITPNDSVTIIVEAKYTTDKRVSGTATVTLQRKWSWQEEQRIKRTVKLDKAGKASIVIENKELKEYEIIQTSAGYYYRTDIMITASVVEDHTEIVREKTKELTVHAEDVQVIIQKQVETFKPGFQFSVLVGVTKRDDTPIPASYPKEIEITVIYNYPYPFNSFRSTPYQDNIVRNISLSVDGMATLDLQPPHKCTAVGVEAKYQRYGSQHSAISKYITIDAAKSPSASFLQLIPRGDFTVNAEDSLAFTMKLNKQVPVVIIQVISRGTIILVRNEKMNGREKNVTLKITKRMAPRARIIAYAVLPNNKEIVVDAFDIKVKGLFQNSVQLSIDHTSAEPGNNVTIRVDAKPHSLIGLVAVDQSVLLLKKGNDITTDMIERDISNYNTFTDSPWRIASDAKSLFENADLVVLTDANLFKEKNDYSPNIETDQNAPYLQTSGMVYPPGMEPIPTRSNFPETWIWENMSTGYNDHVLFHSTVPDTVTSWVLSAFAINEESGIGVALTGTKLQVFRPFFIQLNLPYSVKRGEKFALQVLVFNYMEEEQEVTVTLKTDSKEAFALLNKDGSLDETNSKNLRLVSVPASSSKAVYFPIQPLSVGDVIIHVTAQSSKAGDAIEIPLRVEHEGYRVNRNIPLIIDLSKSSSFEKVVSIDIPEDIVAGSEKVRVDVIGDLMGPILSNLANLIHIPSGCGEQIMLKFVPNIVALNYLKATKRSDPILEATAKRYIQEGYQRELTYRRFDNSYSVFGGRDDEGSTWLTAFVVRSFTQAKSHMFIHEKVISQSVEYLLKKQKESGEFQEDGRVMYKAMMGGTNEKGVSITAYVLATLLESGITNENATLFLEDKLDEISSDVYTLSLIAYTLQLANSTKADDAVKSLEKMKIVGNDGTVHWETKTGAYRQGDSNYFFQPRPVNVEVTAYCLRTYMLRGETDKALPIVRWLIMQRNALGGFSSTQDTVIAIQAVAEFATKTYQSNSEMVVGLNNGMEGHNFEISPANSIVLQSYEVSNTNKPLHMNATGKGTVFAQISYSYHKTIGDNSSAFDCTHNLTLSKKGKKLLVNWCCRYTQPGQSNMAVAEIESLTGFSFDYESTNKLIDIPQLQLVELEKGNTQANVYFDKLDQTPVCFTLESRQYFQVVEQKPAQFSIFDYYEPSQQVKQSYSLTETSSPKSFCEHCWSETGEIGSEEIREKRYIF